MTLTSHRNGTARRDRAIVDTLYFLEAGLVPGWVSTDELMRLWSTSQAQVSRRLIAVNSMGVIKITREYGRSYLYRPDHPSDVRLWLLAVNERRRTRLLRERAERRQGAARQRERKARWNRLRERLSGGE